MIEDLDIFEEKLQEAIAVWKATNEFTDNLCELFQELIETTFTKRMPVFPSDEIREDCKVAALLACYDGLKRFNPDAVRPKTGEKAKAWSYFSIVIRSSLAGGYVKAVNHKKTFQNESKDITL
jgi:hypothetical protein